ncbi:MAG: hypothetical protein WBK88_07080 [Methanothrix sp.]
MMTSLMVLPGLQSGNPEWIERYLIDCDILDGQMTETKVSMMAATFFSLPMGTTPPVYRAGW